MRKGYNNSSPESQRHVEFDEYQLPIYPKDKYRYSVQVNARRGEPAVPATVRRTIDNFDLVKDLGR
jgi:hypothetical protein